MELTTIEIIGTRTRVEMVFDRAVRTVPSLSYDPVTRAFTEGVRGEYYATAHIAFVGREVDGSWTLFTTDGAPIKSGLNNKVSAWAAARRHFGPVIIA
ncbi:hypothetical protein [Streptomyces sp. NPDC088554]|uniref:hypothetical protein n=1 Tax=Streptomyces sp. NPDC088554 TaxID=3365865 RepID=UPI00382D7187